MVGLQTLDTTIVTMDVPLSDQTLNAWGSSRRSPGDRYSETIGARLAVARALEDAARKVRETIQPELDAQEARAERKALAEKQGADPVFTYFDEWLKDVNERNYRMRWYG